MKKIRKGTEFVWNDGVKRKIIDIEKYTNCNYICYYVDINYNDGEDDSDFFEKDSEIYHKVIEIINS